MGEQFSTLKHDVWLPYRFAVGPVFHRFYEGLKERKILGNRCPSCARTLAPARSFCPTCHQEMGEWVELAQNGEIVTWTWIGRPSLGMPVQPPFVAALIRLDGTDCDLLHLIGGIDVTSPDKVSATIRIGTSVKALWADERRGHMLDIRYFEPR